MAASFLFAASFALLPLSGCLGFGVTFEGVRLYNYSDAAATIHVDITCDGTVVFDDTFAVPADSVLDRALDRPSGVCIVRAQHNGDVAEGRVDMQNNVPRFVVRLSEDGELSASSPVV